MFFAEGEKEKFPKEIKRRISLLEGKDKKIYLLNKNNKKVDTEIIDFVMDSIHLFLENEKKLNPKQKELMIEAIGNIPITFFVLDNLKVKKEVKETIKPLVDIIDSASNLQIDRKKLILKVLENLERLK